MVPVDVAEQAIKMPSLSDNASANGPSSKAPTAAKANATTLETLKEIFPDLCEDRATLGYSKFLNKREKSQISSQIETLFWRHFTTSIRVFLVAFLGYLFGTFHAYLGSSNTSF